MTEERRKVIALKIVEQMVIDRGIPGAEQLKRDMGNEAKKLGIPTSELMKFYRSCAPRALGQIFGFRQVSLIMSKPVLENTDSESVTDEHKG